MTGSTLKKSEDLANSEVVYLTPLSKLCFSCKCVNDT